MKKFNTSQIEEALKSGKQFYYFIYFVNNELVYDEKEHDGIIGVISSQTGFPILKTEIPPQSPPKISLPPSAKTKNSPRKKSQIVIKNKKLAESYLSKEKLTQIVLKCTKDAVWKTRYCPTTYPTISLKANIFTDLNLDSLDRIELIMEIEKHIGIHVPDITIEEMFQTETSADISYIIDFLHNKLCESLIKKHSQTNK